MKTDKKMDTNSAKTLGMLLAGAASGAVIGLLLAPEKGSETREKLYKKSNEVADDLEKRLEEINSGIKNQINNSRKELADMMENGNWYQLRGKVKKNLSTLTGNNLLFAKGKKDEMLSKLSSKVGKSKEELEDILAEL